MAKKLLSGDGWKVTYANEEPQPIEIISKPPEKQKAKISVEKRNKGKIVTCISGLVLNEKDMTDLAKLIKVACGTGGSVNKNTIEIQGEHVEKIKNWLVANKYGIK
ncbi:MAG: translation initiation factor [Candidatus Sericytochromatia bacterium]